MRIGLPLLFLLLTACFVLACERPFVEPPADERGRIVLGVSVDGARLGEDTSTVFVKLGPPARIVRGGANIRFFFDVGPAAGVELYFDVEPSGFLSARSAFRITAPYDGQTEEGIGIDSRRAEVIESIGEPLSTVRVGTDGIHDRYAAFGNQLIFIYVNNRLAEIGMAGRSLPEEGV
jgi:hypothetical protein